jgi:predicted DNA binding protein
MRYVRAVFKPPSGQAFHPTGQALAERDAVTREYVHRTNLLPDDTVASLVSVRGDPAVAEATLADLDSVLDVAVADPPGPGFIYLHHESNEAVTSMLRANRDSTVVMDPPIEIHENGDFEVVYVGTDAAFAGSFGEIPNVDVDVDVLETGAYAPCRRDVFDRLTDRQQEAVAAAVRMGYYRNPREATQGDVAAAIGCSPGTAGEHLRKAEERVFACFVDAD